MEDKKVTLKLENVSKVFAKVESDDVTHALYNVNAQMDPFLFFGRAFYNLFYVLVLIVLFFA